MILPVLTYALTFINVRETQPTYIQHLQQNYAFTETTGILSELYENVSFKEMLETLNISEGTYKAVGYTMSYMILIEFVHLMTDFLLMLPRLIQKFFSKWGLTDE